MNKHFEKTIDFIVKYHAGIILIAVYASLAAALCVFSSGELFYRLSFETGEVGNYDSYLYFTVGHGFAEGVPLYSGMYENKGPMIFILSALSYKLFGNFRMMNFLSFTSFVTVLVLPAVFCSVAAVKHKTKWFVLVPAMICATGASILFVDFSQNNCEAVQVEIFGSAACLIALICSYLTDFGKPGKFYSPQVILCGAFTAVSALFKEPFALLCAAGILLMCHKKEDLIYRVLFPAMWCAATFVIVLVATGSFVPYFTVYINNMLSTHVTKYGSPFERALDVTKVFNYYGNFSDLLPVVIVFAAALTVVREILFHYSDSVVVNVILKSVCALKPAVVLFTGTFAVGLGGQYYNHHYVFFIPVVYAFMMCATDLMLSREAIFPGVKELKKAFSAQSGLSAPDEKTDATDNEKPVTEKLAAEKSSLTLFAKLYVLPLLIIAVCLECFAATRTPTPAYEAYKTVVTRSAEVKEHAAYIDEVLDIVGEDTYLWMGFNGYIPTAYTKHLPSGPCFAQDANNFAEADTYFATQFKRQLKSANVIVYSRLNVGALGEYASTYVKNNFTTEKPASLASADITAPESLRFIIYYRKTAFEF